MIFQKPKQFQGIIYDNQNRYNYEDDDDSDQGISKIDNFTYEYNQDKINFTIKYDNCHKQNVQIDYNFTQTQKVNRKKYGRTQNRKTNYASKLVDFYLVPFAQNILMTNNKQKCNWDKFGGYKNFRDKYYDDGYHYQSRFLTQISEMYSGCSCGYSDISLQVGEKLQIVDLMPGFCDLTIIYSEKPGYFKLEQSKFPQFISIDYNEEYYKIMEKYQVKKCLCPIFIKVIEKSENIMYRILILLKAIKNQFPEYYNYLKSLRKDKLIEILSQKEQKLNELIEITTNHTPKNKNQQQQYGIEYMQQQYKLKEDQQKHKKERQGPLGKIIQLYDKYYNEQEDEDFNYEQQLQKEYPNHQQENQEQIIQEEEQENTEKNQSLEIQKDNNKQEESTNKVYEPFIYQQDDNLYQKFTNYDEFNDKEEEEEEEEEEEIDFDIDYNKDQYEDLESLKSENELEEFMLDSESEDGQNYMPHQIKQQQDSIQHLSQQNKLQEKQIQWLLNYTNNLQKQQQQTQIKQQQQLQLSSLQISETNNSNQNQNNNNNNQNIKRSLKQLYDANYEGIQDYFNYQEQQGILQLQNKKICSQNQQQQQLLS